MNARLVWVTKYDLFFQKRERDREKRKIHFRSSGFSNQDFYTATMLHLILCASFNYENESSFINSSPLKRALQDQSHSAVATKRPLTQVHLRLSEGQAPLLFLTPLC